MFNQFIVPEIPTDIRRIPWIGRVLRYDMLLFLELDNKDLYTLEKYNIILVYLIKLFQRVDQLDLLTKITQIVLNEGGNHVTIPVHDDAIKWKHISHYCPTECTAQKPLTRSFDVSFDLRLDKRLSIQSWGWRFETPARSLWRHRKERVEPAGIL